jgi:hypothetical protein
MPTTHTSTRTYPSYPTPLQTNTSHSPLSTNGHDRSCKVAEPARAATFPHHQCLRASVPACLGAPMCRCVGVSLCRCVGVSLCRCVVVSCASALVRAGSSIKGWAMCPARRIHESPDMTDLCMHRQTGGLSVLFVSRCSSQYGENAAMRACDLTHTTPQYRHGCADQHSRETTTCRTRRTRPTPRRVVSCTSAFAAGGRTAMFTPTAIDGA